MNVTVSGIIRALRWQLAVMIMPRNGPAAPKQPEEYTCLMTREDIDVLTSAAGIGLGLSMLPDEREIELPSGIIVKAGEAKRWVAANTRPCTCTDCQSETLGEAAAEMGLVLQSRRTESEPVDHMPLSEHVMFGYLMAFAAGGSELDFTHRVMAEYQASVDAGDLDRKD